MRRLLLAIAFLVLTAARAWPACTGATPNLGLIDCTPGTPASIYEPAWITNFKRLDFAFSSPLAIAGVGFPSPTVSIGTQTETSGGTGQTTYIKGDTLYASATDVLSKLNGNTTTTRKFREQHGNGTAVTVDAWDTITAADIASGTIATARIVASPSNSRCLRIDSGGSIVVASGDCFTGAGDITLSTGDNLNAGTADSTIPNKVGVTAPATCNVGMTFFDSDATAGQNIYGCTATNTWTLEGDGGGGSGDITDVWGCTTGNCNALTAASGDTLDAGSADSTIPWKKGTSPPGTCTTGEGFFDTDATAGQNIYGCTATNTWTLEGDGGAGGGITGTLTSGRITVASGSSTVADTANFTFDTTNFRQRIQNATTASDNATNMLQLSGTMPTSPSTTVSAVNFDISSAGSTSQASNALRVNYTSGYTGSSGTRAATINNGVAGTGNTLNLNSSTGPTANSAVQIVSNGAGAGLNIGLAADASGTSALQVIGVLGKANDANAHPNIGVLGNAANSTEGTNLKNVAVYATLHSALVTGSNISAAIISDGAGSDILRGYNAASLKARIGSNGEMYVGNFTVSGLPTCSTSDKGLRATVTDANAACTFAGALTGGGSTVCPAYCDGSAWKTG